MAGKTGGEVILWRTGNGCLVCGVSCLEHFAQDSVSSLGKAPPNTKHEKPNTQKKPPMVRATGGFAQYVTKCHRLLTQF
jgi:hypothetical protein